jgi:hypothetical protein
MASTLSPVPVAMARSTLAWHCEGAQDRSRIRVSCIDGLTGMSVPLVLRHHAKRGVRPSDYAVVSLD